MSPGRVIIRRFLKNHHIPRVVMRKRYDDNNGWGYGPARRYRVWWSIEKPGYSWSKDALITDNCSPEQKEKIAELIPQIQKELSSIGASFRVTDYGIVIK